MLIQAKTCAAVAEAGGVAYGLMSPHRMRGCCRLMMHICCSITDQTMESDAQHVGSWQMGGERVSIILGGKCDNKVQQQSLSLGRHLF